MQTEYTTPTDQPADQTNVPARFREAAFRRYERIIQTAVELFPSRLVLPPRIELSQETIAARLRDAIRSLHKFRWRTTVDMSKFDSVYHRIQVRREDDNVVVLLRSEREILPVENQTLTCFCCSDTDLNAFIQLRSSKLIPPILFMSLTPEQHAILASHEQLGIIGVNNSEKGVLIV